MLSQQDFDLRRDKINKKLTSAYRYGTSTFRLGLIRQGISDHLPIRVSTARFHLISWNLLSDDHLYNNFLSISGSRYLIKVLNEQYPDGTIYFKQNEYNRLNHLFSELSQYLYRQAKRGTIRIDNQILEGFVSLEAQPSMLTRSRDANKIAEKEQEVLFARRAIIDLFNNHQHEYAAEFRLAIRHALELIHHIKGDMGALQWKNRYQLLQQQTLLTQQLREADFLCFQECTEPDDLLALFKGKNYKMISHHVNDHSKDYCVIIYNADKYELVGEPIKTDLSCRKPTMLAKFNHIEQNKSFVLGSTHQPGGAHHKIDDLMQCIEACDPNKELNYYIAGDYNHTKDFFSNEQQKRLYYPQLGTMSGNDYGNVNQNIDAVMTNCEEDVYVERLEHLAVAAPAKTPVIVDFVQQGQSIHHASARFFSQVSNQCAKAFAKVAITDLGQAKSNLTKQIQL